MTVARPVIEFADLIATRLGSDAPRLLMGPLASVTGSLPKSGHGMIHSLRRGQQVAKVRESSVVVVDWDWVFSERGIAKPLMRRRVSQVLKHNPVSVVASGAQSPQELESQVTRVGCQPVFSGSYGHGEGAGTAVCICESESGPSRFIGIDPPKDFSVVALVTTFNERDVIGSVLDDLYGQGVEAYVLDNWSTDGTWDVVQEHRGQGVIGCERWPDDGPPNYFDLKGSLERMVEVSHSLGADWYIKHDADEIRRAPWPGVSVREALWGVQRSGFNVVDFTVLNYPPIDNGYTGDVSPWDYFGFFEFGSRPGHFRQLKAWRYQGQDVEYAHSGSHKVSFSGMRVFPYKFELHHYPIRSQSHGIRKVLSERRNRYLPSAKERGWHNQYDHVDAGTNFLKSHTRLERRNEENWRRFLLERLGGIGLEMRR